MYRSPLDATPPAGTANPHALPLAYRLPVSRLGWAREDHARALTLAATYRKRHAHGERGVLDLHDWPLRHARALRLAFPGQLSGETA